MCQGSICLPGGHIIIGKHMIVKVTGTNTYPQVADAHTIFTCAKQFLQRSMACCPRHMHQVLGAATSKGKAKAIYRLVFSRSINTYHTYFLCSIYFFERYNTTAFRKQGLL